MSKKKVWILVTVLCVLAIVVAANIWGSELQFPSSERSVSVKIYRVSKNEIKSSVIASGVIVPAGEEKVYRDAGLGEIEAVLVSEGQYVKQGSPLIRYRDDEIKKLQVDLEVARKRLELQLSDIHNNMDKAEEDFKNELQSLPAGAEPDQTARETGRKLRDLENQQKVAELEISVIDRQRSELKAKRDKLTVTSRISGRVEKIDYGWQSGSSVSEPILHILSDQNYQVRGTITEFDDVLVKSGQQVAVKPKVLSGKTWKGVIRKIDSIPVNNTSISEINEKKDAVTSYPFTVELLDKSEELKIGYHVFVDIEIGSKGERLVVPHQAVLRENDTESVLLVEQDRIRRKQVVTGDSNDIWKEVVEGLSEGDIIVMNPSSDMKDGTVVQAEEAS